MECPRCHTELADFAAYCHACGARQDGAEESRNYEYAAFVSYRHLPRDHDVAVEVQKAVETYRLPRRLGGPALGKCFRDEDELPASHSLPDRIADALAKSRSLIVVCSPDTPDSTWVRREIELFAQLHGRERVFAVLAHGSSKDSIPELLRARLEPTGDIPGRGFAHDPAQAPSDAALHRTPLDNDLGATVHAPSPAAAHAPSPAAAPCEPLAADLRPSVKGRQRRSELLRIIAALAGCSYDDLRQRDRARRRKRMAALVVAAIAIAAALGAFVAFAHNQRQDALAAESARLAAESRQLLEQGDRYGAIESALAGLPPSSADAGRPLVPEARRALEDALQIHATPDTYWRAGYSIRTEHAATTLGNGMVHETGADDVLASAVAIDDLQGVLAVSDDAGAVTTYDVKTGRTLSLCSMPELAAPLDGGLYVRHLLAAGGRLVVSNAGDSPMTVCFSVGTGQTAWTLADVALPTMDDASDGDHFAATQPDGAGGFTAAAFDMASGQVIGKVRSNDAGIPPASQGICSTIGHRLGDYYLAVGDTLTSIDLESSETRSVQLALPCATSIAYGNGTVVVATADPMPEDGIERRFAVEAFDAQLRLLWRHEGTFGSQMMVNGNWTALLEGAPVVAGFALDGTQVAVSAGREAMTFDLATGAETLKVGAAQTVVGAQVLEGVEEGVCDLVVASADGTVTLRDLTGTNPDAAGDSTRLDLPFPIRWAHLCALGDQAVVLVAPADANDRIAAFRTDFTHGEKPDRDYSLDELIDMARDVLASGGRS